MSSRALLKYWMVPLSGMLLLVVASGLLVQQQFKSRLQEAVSSTGRELQLLSSLLLLNLQEGNYQYLEDTLNQFGNTDSTIVELKVVAGSGFVISTYQRPSPAEYPHHVENTIHYSYQGQATLTLVRDLVEVYDQRRLLVTRLLTGFAVVGALLGFLVYTIVLRQREARLLLNKTHELDRTNQALTDENNRRRRAEEALFDAKEQAEVTLQSIGDAVITTDIHGKVKQLNPVAQQLTGWTQADARGQPLTTVFYIINSLDRTPVANPVDRVLETGQIVGLANHTSLISRQGREYQIADSAAPIRDKNGDTTGVVLVFHDVSEQYRQQAKIAAREAELRKITNILPGPVTRVDAEGRYIFVSNVYTTWFGKKPEDVLGLTQLEAIGPELYAQFEPYFKRARAGKEASFEVTLPTLSGGIRHALVSVIPDFDSEGAVCGYFTIGIDISRSKQAEQETRELRDQLLQATKMEAVGHLTAGIAHDFNNMLGAILGYTELSQHVIASGQQEDISSYLAAILKASNRARDLIAQMLTFSRKSARAADDVPVIELAPVVKEVVTLLRSSIPATIDLNYQITADKLQARIHAVHLHQIIVNLGINARDAITEYGKIEISLSTYQADGSPCASCQYRFGGGHYAQLTVRDSGNGIADSIRGKIFDPFFTTKGVGKGTGMGLSVVHGLVHSVGGHILIASDTAGSAISILLPLVEAELNTESLATSPPGSQHLLSGARLMVVDDEPELSQLLQEMLYIQGAEVTVFNNPLDALARFEKNPPGFDLVITDETMPGMSGMHLAKQLLAIRPDLPVILYTGYSEHATPEAAAANGLAGFFYKPVKMNELLQKIQQLLSAGNTK